MLTIETDARTPFCDAHIPPAEWIYWSFRRGLLEAADPARHLGAYLREVQDRTSLRFDRLPDFPAARSLAAHVDARVDWGRWVWDCPTPGCGEAQIASDTDHRGFCVGCFNGGDGWWPVVFPAPRRQIEELLGRRPLAARNWRTGETLLSVQVENLAHGVDPDLDGQLLPAARDVLPAVRRELGLATVNELEI